MNVKLIWESNIL